MAEYEVSFGNFVEEYWQTTCRPGKQSHASIRSVRTQSQSLLSHDRTGAEQPRNAHGVMRRLEAITVCLICAHVTAGRSPSKPISGIQHDVEGLGLSGAASSV
jgi:hypothetical protein